MDVLCEQVNFQRSFGKSLKSRENPLQIVGATSLADLLPNTVQNRGQMTAENMTHTMTH